MSIAFLLWLAGCGSGSSDELDSLEAEVSDLRQQVAELRAAVESSGATDVSDLEAAVEDLSGEVSSLSGRVDGVEEDVSSAVARIDALEGDVAALRGDLLDVQARVEALEDASGNDWWIATGGDVNLGSGSSTWQQVSGVQVYVTTSRAGPVAVWAHVVCRDTYQSFRLTAEATSGSWSETSEATQLSSGYPGTVVVEWVFDLPAAGSYNLYLEATGGNIGDAALLAVQLANPV